MSIRQVREELCALHETLEKCRALLEQFEYSSDGAIKRYPEPQKYEVVMAELKRVSDALNV